MNNLDNLTLVILTYKTGKEILDNCLSSIDKNIKIIVVENSTYFENQKYFEDKYKNIKIILTEKNLGYAGGNNFGLNMVKTKYALIFNPDIAAGNNPTGEKAEYLPERLLSKSTIFISVLDNSIIFSKSSKRKDNSPANIGVDLFLIAEFSSSPSEYTANAYIGS